MLVNLPQQPVIKGSMSICKKLTPIQPGLFVLEGGTGPGRASLINYSLTLSHISSTSPYYMREPICEPL